jgi:hypothetical protein
MSATRDKSQKITFIYKNFHEIYRKGKEAAQRANPETPGLTTGQVLKVDDLNASTFAVFNPPTLMAKRLEAAATAAQILRQNAAPASAPAPAPKSSPKFPTTTLRAPAVLRSVSVPPVANPAIESLRQNLRELNDLHSRLKFMLQELEELSKKDEE